MQRTTAILLSTAAGFGVALALWHMRTGVGRSGPPWPIGVLHGALGLVGLGGLILLLRGPPHGEAMGVGSFGTTAAVLFTAAVAAGIAVPVLNRRRPGRAAVATAVHAGLAITAYVLFLAWISMG